MPPIVSLIVPVGIGLIDARAVSAIARRKKAATTMLDADRKLAWGAVLVMAVIAVELAWLIFVGPAQNYSGQGAQNAGDQNYAFWQYSGFWIALFTVALTVSTGGLWVWTKRSADIAAQALTVLERPWMIVGDFDLALNGATIRGVTLSIENVGRSPGFIHSYSGGGKVIAADRIKPPAKFDPIVIRLKTIEMPLLGNIIIHGRKETSEATKGVISQEVINAVFDGRSILLERGVLKYRDTITTELHETSFCIRYDASAKKFVEYGGPTYNYVR